MKYIAILLLAAVAIGACRNHEINEPALPTVPTNPTPNPPPPTSAVTFVGAMDISKPLTVLTPPVIMPDYQGDVLVEFANPSIKPESLKTTWGTVMAFRDDGTNGDRIAGDKVFSLLVPASRVQSVNQPADVHRPLIGGISFPGGFGSIFAEVYSPAIPLLVPEIVVPGAVQMTPNLVNIVVSRVDLNTAAHAREFYRHFPDRYDFLNIVLTGYNANRHHISVQNQVEGIGQPIFNNSGSFGSAGRLQGINVFPLPAYFDGALSTFSHELGHQWINFLPLAPLNGTRPHWPLSDLASGVMGWSTLGGQGLSFDFNLTPNGNEWTMTRMTAAPEFNDLELYLMGLIPAAQVSEHFVFDDQTQYPTAIQTMKLTGPVTRFTIDDIVASAGVRRPAAETNKQFTLATVIVSPRLLTAQEMSFYNFFAKRVEAREEVLVAEGHSRYLSKPFYVATGGRASINTTIER